MSVALTPHEFAADTAVRLIPKMPHWPAAGLVQVTTRVVPGATAKVGGDSKMGQVHQQKLGQGQH